MSSTNRGSARAADDFYRTPGWVTRAILPHLDISSHDTVCDPCAGEGAILREIARGTPWGIELDPERAHECDGVCSCRAGNALAPAPWGVTAPDVVIMNPPFSLALEFCERALREVVPGGTVAALMRLAMVAGQKRAAFWKAHPADVYVLPRRPSFTGHGTDSADYAWFVWGIMRGNRWWRLEAES